MSKSIESRISKLEQEHGGGEVFGVRYSDSRTVTVDGEEMDLDEFFVKYPDGVLLHVVYKSTPPDVIVNWDEDE